MNLYGDYILVILLIVNLLVLGTSRVRACIRLVALQGVLLGAMPLIASALRPEVRMIVQAFLVIILKGIVFPWILFRVLRGMEVRREIAPVVGYTSSVLMGLAFIALSFWLSSRMPAAIREEDALALPVALSTMFTGLFLIVARRKALTQVLGYIVLENGIFAFALAHKIEAGFVVELGIMMDAFFAVAVMGAALSHIYRTFDAIDTDRLSVLKDWKA